MSRVLLGVVLVGRFIKNDKEERAVKAAIRTYEDDKGNEISLVSCVHLGEPDFFKNIKEYADTKEKVLFEGTSGDKRNQPENPQMTDPIGYMFGNFLKSMALNMGEGLKYQTDEIDYKSLGENWEACDVSTQELFQQSLSFEQIGKAVKSIFLDPMFDPEMQKFNKEMERKMKSGEMKSQREMMAYVLEMDKNPMEGLYIAEGRNQVVNKRVKEIFDRNEAKDVAVFYGAAHMTGIEEYITKELGFTEKGEKWVEAFKY